ncbi:Spy/CpxP family protein refolding chaperone [Alkalilimnicola ehrlichii MLHE-1]|nr:Spy/CpxP family protein refolding chaperone [Alkalilimnicola ehrlichii]
MTRKQTRPMTRMLTGITLATLLAGTAVTGYSLAQETQRGEGQRGERGGMMMERGEGRHGMMKGHKHGGDYGERMEAHRERMAERLNLDDEQRALWDEFHQHMGPRHDHEQRRGAMREMMEDDFTGRLERMERWSAEHAERMREARRAGERLYQSLDAEQRQMLDEAPREMGERMRDSREERRGETREDRRGERGEGQRRDDGQRGGQGQGQRQGGY